jgi:anti-sigma regulatory factor (Ser/Thr protein kinase)
VEALLIDTWLRGAEPLAIVDVASVSLARELVKREGEALGLPPLPLANLAVVVTELAQNHLAHAEEGMIIVRPVARDGVPGLEIVAADRGEGIADPARALAGRTSAPAGLGTGLEGVCSLSDEVDIDVRWGEGTCVWARKFATTVRRRRSVGVLGRPHPSERVAGDHAAFVRDEEGLILAVADGLGHGVRAREAAEASVLRVVRSPSNSLPDLLRESHVDLARTRGAVMTLARVNERAGRVSLAGVGNVGATIFRHDRPRLFTGSSFVLGMPGPMRMNEEEQELAAGDTLALYTDGVSHRKASLQGRALFREHPIVVAQALLEGEADAPDDALALVVR